MKKHLKKWKVITVVTAVICLLVAILVIPALAADDEHGGLTIGGAVEEDIYNGKDSPYATDSYQMADDLSVMPVTLEAWVYIPESVASEKVGTLYGNFWTSSSYGMAYLNYEILTGAVPRIVWSDSISNVYDITFENAAIPTDEWSHLALVYDGDNGVVSCYVNGELKEEKYYYPEITPDILEMPMALGGDNGHMNPNYFKGGIGDVTVYSDVRSASEISGDCSLGMGMTAEDVLKLENNIPVNDNLICYYDIDSSDIGKDIKDESGNGNDLIYSKTWLTEAEMAAIRASYGFTSAYSFAVMGDIQTTTDYYPNNLPGLYEWVVKNKTDKNIQFAITLGDITNDNGRSRRYSKDSSGNYVVDANGTYTHWDIVYDAIKQLDGELPYALIRGNHDVYPDLTTNQRLEGFNTYFGRLENFTSQFTEENGGGRYGDGQYDDVNDVTDLVTGYSSSYANTFQTLTVGENEVQYLFVNLDWIIKDDVVTWANKVIAAHPNHKVIINVHGYMNGDGTTLDPGDPTPNSTYNGDELWESIVSKHSNIKMVLSGHIAHDRIIVNQVENYNDGETSNTVTEMLINPQGFDAQLGGCSMIAMFYFDESGEKLAVEWYSATKDRYFKTINQFTLNLNSDSEKRVTPVWDGATATKPEGEGTEANPYKIANAENLYWISKNITEGSASFTGVYFEQTANIDLGGKDMTSIGTYYVSSKNMAAFGGVYDGRDFKITNGTITTANSERRFNWSEGYGLFGVIYGATIKNVILDDVQIIGKGVTGGIVGRAAAPTVTDTEFYGFNTVFGCEIKDSVKIVTLMTDGEYSAPSVFDDEYMAGRVGSVCGMAHATLIKSCTSAAEIYLSENFTLAGGIVGTAGLNSSVEYCGFSGKIGLKENNTLQNGYIGGLVGAVSPNMNTVDALGNKLGVSGTLYIKNSYSDAELDVSGENMYLGGIAGFLGSLSDVGNDSIEHPYLVENCYSLSSVSANSSVSLAGIVADKTAGEKELYVSGAYSTADVTSGTLEESALDAYVAALTSEIANVKQSGQQRIWLVGSGAPGAAGTDGLKYFDTQGSVYYLYSSDAWSAVRNIDITETTLETEYGTIDSKYATSTMVVFLYDKSTDTYSCIDGSNSIFDVLETARLNTQGSDHEAKAVIYFRADANFDDNFTNISYITGTILFDLNGKTLYQAKENVGLFSGHAKARDKNWNKSTVIVENGNIVLNTAGLFHEIGASGGKAGQQYEVNTTDTSYKTGDFIFNNVNISLAEGAKFTSLMGSYKDHSIIVTRNAKMGLNVTFDDNCVIDITNAPSGFVLFDACDTSISGMISNSVYATNSIVNVTVGACEIKADSSFVWHKVADNGSSVVYTKNSSEEFMTLTVPSTFTPDTSATFIGEYDYVYGLKKLSEADGEAIYTLGGMDTPYGNIPSGNEDYAFLTYVANADGTYTFRKGFNAFADALADAGSATKSVAGKKCVIYMTKDAGSGTANGSGNCGFNIGTIIIDLGGHVLTQENSEPLIRAHAKYDNGIATSNPGEFYLPGYYEIINGDIILTTNALFYIGTEGSGYNNHTGPYPKQVYWTLDGVDISVQDKDEYITNVFTAFRTCTNLTSTKDIIFNLTVKDNCTLDITGAKKELTLFNANDANRAEDNLNARVNITVDGLEVTANDESFIWADVNEDNGSSVVFTNKSAVTVTISSNTYTYEQLYTPYGNISPTYAAYKFVVFKYANGVYTCVYGNDDFANAVAADKVGARIYCQDPGTKAVVYMRGDYTSSATVTGNLCLMQGEMIIDLGGHTFTQTTGAIFKAYSKCGTHSASSLGKDVGHTATYYVTNGDIVLSNDSLFYVGMEGVNNYAKSECHKALNWTLDRIDISLASGATLTSLFTNFKDNSGYAPEGYNENTPGRDMTFNLIIKDTCTVDISNATKKVTLFNANDTTTKGIVSGKAYCVTNSKVNITVEGCKIITGSASFNLTAVADNGSSVLFGKSEGENYMQLVISKTAAESLDTTKIFKTADGTELVLVKVDETAENAIYRLRQKAAASIDFTPKMSITLDRDLVMNVYIPAEILLKFTFNGEEYANLEEISSNLTTVNGKKYYLMTVALPAAEAAKEIKLIATVSVGAGTATGTFMFSIPKYAEKVINNSESETEIQLVKDVLSYVRAAYIYFKTVDAGAIAKIDAILGENYDASNAPAFNGSSTAPKTGLESVTLVLGATPATRFYVSGEAASYDFYLGNMKLDTLAGTDSNGSYIDIDSYAYAMCGTITYYIDGVLSGSYHVNSYYEFAKTQNNPGLVTLVERFAKYCESAEAYRAEVTK